MTEHNFEQEEIEILGHKIRLANIENPHLKRAIRNRQNFFLFNYGDSPYSDGHTEIHVDSGSGSNHRDEITYSYQDTKDPPCYDDSYARRH